MRVDINLASQPYQDAREFWLRWGTALAAACILSLALLVSTATGWSNARRDRTTIADLRQKIAQRDQLRAQAEEFLNRPENRTTRDESQIINSLIERKAFSWTRLLEDMEKVMPPGVHLVSIQPKLDDENQLAVKMTVAGTSRDRAIELAHRMEESRHFTQTSIEKEGIAQTQSGDSVQFDIAAIYVPEVFTEAAPAAASAAPKKTAPPKTPAAPAKGRKP
ncbi:MAG: PilN domain-containing protein [Candidatus Sulfotelmatobacter sp.]|jgi:type IV pilus assembly protein PilN